jgi:hypothetical protein
VKKAFITCATILISVALANYFWHLHFVRKDDGGGTVLWNSEAAYFFLYDSDDGFVFTVPEYFGELIREYFRAPALPLNRKCVLSVFRVSQSGFERNDQELDEYVGFDFFTPINGDIYAHGPGGMYKWNQGKFEEIPENEALKLGGEQSLSEQEFTSVNGWSKRFIRGTLAGEAPDVVKFSVEVNPRTMLLVKGTNPVSIDLQRADGKAQRIWYHEQKTEWVTPWAYRRLFETTDRRSDRH